MRALSASFISFFDLAYVYLPDGKLPTAVTKTCEVLGRHQRIISMVSPLVGYKEMIKCIRVCEWAIDESEGHAHTLLSLANKAKTCARAFKRRHSRLIDDDKTSR